MMSRLIVALAATWLCSVASASTEFAPDIVSEPAVIPDAQLEIPDPMPYILAGGDTEVSISYGALPSMRWIGGYSCSWEGLRPWGAVAISIDHRFARRLWLGVSYTISSASTAETGHGYKGSVAWHGFMVHARYLYGWTDRWAFYGTAGVGVLISYMQPSDQPTYNRTHCGFEVMPIGAQFGVLPNFDLFAEAGFGIQGVLRAGIRIDF